MKPPVLKTAIVAVLIAVGTACRGASASLPTGCGRKACSSISAAHAAAAVRLPRGGAGIFSNAVSRLESRAANVTSAAKLRAAELDSAAERIRDEALQRARAELTDLEREARTLAAEAERAARSKTRELELAARGKAAEVKDLAKETTVAVATSWEKEARSRVEEVEGMVRRKAMEVERVSRQKARELRRSLPRDKEEEDFLFSGMLRSMFRRGDSAVEATPTRSPEPDALLSKKASAVLSHVLLLVILCTSLTNLAGYPPFVLSHWEGGFGEMFIPQDSLSLTQKRIFAGVMELSSIFLMRPKRTRVLGIGTITTMYTWGCVVNSQMNSAGKAAVLAVLSAIAWLLLVNELF